MSAGQARARGRTFPASRCPSGRNPRGARRDAGAAGPRIRHRTLHRSASSRCRRTNLFCRPAFFNIRPPFADFTAPQSHGRWRSNKMFGRDFAQLPAADQRQFVDLMRQNKIEGWTGPPGRGCGMRWLRADAVDVVTVRWKATRRSHSLHAAYSPEKSGEMTNEKVDVVIVGAGASAPLCLGACEGRKKVCCWSPVRTGALRSHQFRDMGPPHQACRRSDCSRRQEPDGLRRPGRWVSVARPCTTTPTFHGCCDRFRTKSEHNRAHELADRYEDGRAVLRQVAREIGVSGTPRRSKDGGRPEKLSDAADETFRNGDIWLKGFEASASRWCRPRRDEFGGIQGTAGLPVRRMVPCRLSDRRARQSAGHVSGRCAQGRAEVRALCTVTRVLTNQAGTRITGVNITTTKHQKADPGGQRRRAGRVVGAESAASAQSATDSTPGFWQCKRPGRQIH